MKTSIKLMAMVLSIFAIAFGTTSCDKVDEFMEDHDPQDVKSVNVEYSMDLSQTWFDYFDIDVTYYDEKGKPNTLRVTEKWSYGFSVKPKEAPRNYVFTVVATPKSQYPEIDGNQYIFSEDIKARYYTVLYDGSIPQWLGSEKSEYIMNATDVTIMRPDELETALTRGTRNLMNFSKTISGQF